MKCNVCGGELEESKTDLPFKLKTNTIVIVKGIPVFQCANCPEYIIGDKVISWIDDILEKVDGVTELEIVRYAA
jgi:YgiT-type zinc finger domain-containing protein